MFIVTDALRTTYPGCQLGILIMRNVVNLHSHQELENMKSDFERALKEKYPIVHRNELKNIKAIQIYDQYYKRFKKTYHVLPQLESVLLKNKDLPKASTLVEAMFMAELKNLLLTAGHDLNSLDLPMELDVASGFEKYINMAGVEKETTAGDMMIVDGQGIISSIIYGPDHRTRITPETQDVLFIVYGPPGIEGYEVFEHMQDIQSYVMFFSPEAEVELLKVYDTEGKNYML